MWSILGILTITIGIIVLELPYLFKKRLKRELWVFSVLMIFAVVLSIAKSLNMSIPNPFDWLTIILKPFTNLILNAFQ